MGDVVKLTHLHWEILTVAARHPLGIIVPESFGADPHKRSWMGSVGHLKRLGLVERLARGAYKITPAGLSALTSKEQNNG